MKVKRELIILGLILLLGLGLRIYGLGSESLWGDELVSIDYTKFSIPQITEKTLQDAHPPLYYIILHYWVKFWGNSEFSTRFLSLLFGCLSILLLYRIGSLLFNKEAGLFSALILAISEFHIQYSQEVRMYNLLALLTLFSMYYFIKLLEKRSFSFYLGYLLSSVLLIHTHNYGLFIIIAQNLYFLTLFFFAREFYELSLKPWIKKWFLLQLSLFMLFIPWLLVLFKQFTGLQFGHFWVPATDIVGILESFQEYSGSGLLLLLFLALAFYALGAWEKKGESPKPQNLLASLESASWNFHFSDLNRICLLLCWLLSPIILPFIISHFSAPIYLSRYAISASLAFYLLVALGLSKIRLPKLRFALAGLIVLFSLLNLAGYYRQTNKDQLREAALYIEQNAQAGDLLLFNREFCRLIFNYYSRRTDLAKKVFKLNIKRTPEAELMKNLKAEAANYPRFWLIIVYNQDYERGLARGALLEDYQLLDHKKYIGIEFYLFKKL